MMKKILISSFLLLPAANALAYETSGTYRSEPKQPITFSQGCQSDGCKNLHDVWAEDDPVFPIEGSSVEIRVYAQALTQGAQDIRQKNLVQATTDWFKSRIAEKYNRGVAFYSGIQNTKLRKRLLNDLANQRSVALVELSFDLGILKDIVVKINQREQLYAGCVKKYASLNDQESEGVMMNRCIDAVMHGPEDADNQLWYAGSAPIMFGRMVGTGEGWNKSSEPTLQFFVGDASDGPTKNLLSAPVLALLQSDVTCASMGESANPDWVETDKPAFVFSMDRDTLNFINFEFSATRALPRLMNLAPAGLSAKAVTFSYQWPGTHDDGYANVKTLGSVSCKSSLQIGLHAAPSTAVDKLLQDVYASVHTTVETIDKNLPGTMYYGRACLLQPDAMKILRASFTMCTGKPAPKFD